MDSKYTFTGKIVVYWSTDLRTGERELRTVVFTDAPPRWLALRLTFYAREAK